MYGKGTNYNVCNAKVQITMFQKDTVQITILQRKGPNYNVCHDKVQITIFVRKRSALQCL